MRTIRTTVAIVSIAGLALLVAACGAGSSRTAATSQKGLVVYAQCMRSHGLPAFPDPTGNEGIPKSKIPIGSPNFAVASSACQHLQPLGGLGPAQTADQPHARFADAMAFARCMRSHGFAGFPDPTATGELNPQMVTQAGINLHQPALLTAGDACVSVTHGFLTKAKIAKVVNGAGG